MSIERNSASSDQPPLGGASAGGMAAHSLSDAPDAAPGEPASESVPRDGVHAARELSSHETKGHRKTQPPARQLAGETPNSGCGGIQTAWSGASLLSFAIPPADVNEFGALPAAVREQVQQLLEVMRDIASAPTVRGGVKAQAELFHGERGYGVSTLANKYYAFVKSGGDWRVLADGARIGRVAGKNAALSREFIEWFRALAERNQRKTRPAWRAFMRSWQAGREIPGLDNSLPRHTVPPGCTYANLARILAGKKHKFEFTAMRGGLGAAMRHAPKVLTTRAGLWVGSHYMFDDLWHDNFVAYRGQIVRVLEFDALDVFSAFKPAWGTKPRLRREDGTMEGLPEKFMRMLLARLLFEHGYSPRGTELLAEHGTAAIREDIERILFDRTGGLIQVRRSGMRGEEQAVAGLFRGQGRGNPQFKAPLESLRNVIHNELGSLPAQTGMNRDARPEHTHGALVHAEDLLKAVAVLAEARPEAAQLIRLPVLEYHGQFLPFLHAVYDELNSRTWHELEGWHKCGHVTVEYRLAPDAGHFLTNGDFEALPAGSRKMLMDLAAQDRRYLRQRKLSPREVWQRERHQLKRVPAFVAAEILGQDFATERKCADGYFRFEDQELSPEPLEFEARIKEPNGQERELANDTYLTFVNPFDLGQLFVHDARGRHLGVARRAERVSRGDVENLGRAMGRRNERLADLLAPMKARHADMTRAAAADARWNADVLEQAGAGARPSGGKPRTQNAKLKTDAARSLASAALAAEEEC